MPLGLAIGLLALAHCLSPAAASAHDPGSTRTGLIVASDVYLPVTAYDSVAAFLDAMNRLQQPRAIGTCCGGAWRIHFAALLEQPPGVETLDLRFYDLSSSGSGGRVRIFSSVVRVRLEDTMIFVTDFVISKDMGFAACHLYEVSLWRSAGAEPSVLAKGSFKLE